MSARLPAARRRRQLLDVALGAFSERGFHATSMSDVADAAGVTKPVLYQHFRSKRELYLALIDDVGGRLRDAIEKATSEAVGPRQQVEAGFAAYFRFVADEQDAFKLLFGGGAGGDDEFVDEVRALEAMIADAVASLIDVAGLDPERRNLLAHGIVGLAEGTGRYWIANGMAGNPERLAAHVAQLAWAGLRSVRGA